MMMRHYFLNAVSVLPVLRPSRIARAAERRHRMNHQGCVKPPTDSSRSHLRCFLDGATAPFPPLVAANKQRCGRHDRHCWRRQRYWKEKRELTSCFTPRGQSTTLPCILAAFVLPFQETVHIYLQLFILAGCQQLFGLGNESFRYFALEATKKVLSSAQNGSEEDFKSNQALAM